MTFEEWAEGSLVALLRFARVLCSDRGLAEDVVQEVLIKVHRQWPRIAKLDQPETYIRKMVVNEYLSWRRKWSRMHPVADVIADDHVADHSRTYADRDYLATAIAALPRQQRAVIVLRYYAAYSDPEIADLIGCGTSAVRAYAARALVTLRAAHHLEVPTS